MRRVSRKKPYGEFIDCKLDMPGPNFLSPAFLLPRPCRITVVQAKHELVLLAAAWRTYAGNIAAVMRSVRMQGEMA